MSQLTPEEIKQKWLLQNKPVCICKGIPRKRFTAAIQQGADTLDKVNRVVGSGSGSCKGERCSPVICQMLLDAKTKGST